MSRVLVPGRKRANERSRAWREARKALCISCLLYTSVDDNGAEYSAERNDVDRNDVHPAAQARFIFDECTGGVYNQCHKSDRRLSGKMQMPHHRFRAHLKHIDQTGDSGEDDRKEEDNGNKATAGHLCKDRCV